MNTHSKRPIAIVCSVLAALLLLAASPAFAGWLGIGVADITKDKLQALKLKEERGVEIVNLRAESPAAKAGLKEHDVVLEYNGQRVEGVEQFQRMVRETPAGREVRLLISRDGATQTVTPKLGEGPARPRAFVVTPRSDGDNEFAFRMPMPKIEIPDMHDFPNVHVFSSAPRLGVDVEGLNKQLGEYFGVAGGEGLLVRSVEPNSAADKAGIKAGDVIVKVDGEKVASASELRSALRRAADKGGFPVAVVRNRKEMTVTAKIERQDDRDLLTPRAERME